MRTCDNAGKICVVAGEITYPAPSKMQQFKAYAAIGTFESSFLLV